MFYVGKRVRFSVRYFVIERHYLSIRLVYQILSLRGATVAGRKTIG